MLLKLETLIQKYNMKITGVIQAGAHYGEEVNEFIKSGIDYFIFFEPSKSAFQILKKNTESISRKVLVNCALGETQQTAMMNTETRNNGQSNSILSAKKHLEYYPDIVFSNTEIVDVMPLDHFKIEWYNFLVMDVQGYEMKVLKGATETLKDIDYIYTEVNREELYEGCAMIEDLDSYLTDFTRVETKWTNQGWGDALYIRKTLL